MGQAGMLALMGSLAVLSLGQASGNAGLYGVVKYKKTGVRLVEIDPVTGQHTLQPHSPFQNLPYVYNGVETIDTKRNVIWSLANQANASFGDCEFLGYNIANGVAISVPLTLGACDTAVSLGYAPDLDALVVVAWKPNEQGMGLWHIPMDTYTPKFISDVGMLGALFGDSLTALDSKRHTLWVQWQNMTIGNFIKGIDYRTGKDEGAVRFPHDGSLHQAQYDPKTDAVWVVGSEGATFVPTLFKFSNSAPYVAKKVATYPGLKPLAQSMAIHSESGTLYTIAKDHPKEGPLPPFTPVVPDPTPFGNPQAPMPEQAGNIVAISLSTYKILSSTHTCTFEPSYTCPKVMFWFA